VAGTSLDDLVAVTGLGRGSLYGAFGDKHTIFLRALDEYSNMTMAAVRAELRDSAESAYDRLVRHIRSTARANATDSKRYGCLTAKSAAELAATDKAIARSVKRFINAYQAELTETIATAQREGDIDSAVNPRHMAVLVLAVLRGMEALRKRRSVGRHAHRYGRTGHRAAPPRARRTLATPDGQSESPRAPAPLRIGEST
jgi:TetR/AcrR family transcriptional repressor of nem operon